MKKMLFLSLMVIGFQLSSNAQSEKFMAAMGATLQQFGQAKSEEEYAAAAAKFERIADAEKTEWLAYYYAALVKGRMAQQKFGGDPDKVADEAQVLLDKAAALNGDKCEINCVKYILITAKLMVDPQSRYMQFMAPMQEALETAKKADANNPRPFALQAIGLKNTPEAFGGGCLAAKPLAQKASELFASFKPASALHPNWGKEMVDGILAECK